MLSRLSLALVFMLLGCTSGQRAFGVEQISGVRQALGVHRELPFHFKGRDGLMLKGILSLPEKVTGKLPVVIFIGGSGPWDENQQAQLPERQGTGTSLLEILPIQRVANACVAQGMAFVRYAKRGVSAGGFQNEHWKDSNLDNLLADLGELLDAIARDPRVDGQRIGLLGHSEGAALASWAAGHDPRVKAMVFMGMPRRNLKDILAYQLVERPVEQIFDRCDRPNPDGTLDAGEIEAAIARGARFPNWQAADRDGDQRLSKGELSAYLGLPQGFERWLAKLDHAKPDESITARNGVQDMPSAWYKQHFAHESVGESWKSITKPVFVLQGLKDRNTPFETEAQPFEAQLLQQGHLDYRVIGFPGLSHTFTDEQGQSQIDEALLKVMPWLRSRL